jgi:hypothetical protein
VKNISNIIAEILTAEGAHIASHVTTLKGDLPDGKRLTLKIEDPTCDLFGQPRKAEYGLKKKELMRAARKVK